MHAFRPRKRAPSTLPRSITRDVRGLSSPREDPTKSRAQPLPRTLPRDEIGLSRLSAGPRQTGRNLSKFARQERNSILATGKTYTGLPVTRYPVISFRNCAEPAPSSRPSSKRPRLINSNLASPLAKSFREIGNARGIRAGKDSRDPTRIRSSCPRDYYFGKMKSRH